MHERIEVDDALISTDVDKLIKAISTKKTIELGVLEKETRIPHKNIEKWVHVLEEEGYVKIEYKLTKTYVVWIGEEVEAEEPGSPAEIPREIRPTEKKEYEGPLEKSTPFEEALPKTSTPFEPLDKEEEEEVKKVEEGLRVFDEKIEGEEEKDVEEKAKHDVLESLTDEGEMEKEGTIDVQVTKEERENEWFEEEIERNKKAEEFGEYFGGAKEEEKEAKAGPKIKKLDSESETRNQRHEIRGPKRETRDQSNSKLSARSEAPHPVMEAPLREKISEYLDEIQTQKEEIERLKKRKDKVYRDKYMKLESKMEADIVSITERILEKEGKILELKEKALELPDRIAEIEKLQSTAEKIGNEGKSTLERVRKKVSAFQKEIENAEENIQERITDVKSGIAKETERMSALEATNRKMDSQHQKLTETLKTTEAHISELRAQMDDTLALLEEATERKVDITDSMDHLRVAIDRREKQLEELNSEFEEVKKLEQWVSEYVGDYERKIEEIENYVDRSEEEMERLRKGAEEEYIKKYLRELEGLTRTYEHEMEGAALEEKNIEHQIEDAKKRLAGLIEESQMIIKKMHTETQGGMDFRTAVSERKSATRKVASLVEEKGKEKERLKEDLERVRKKRKGKKK